MKSASLTIMPGDIRRDPALRRCSLEARGLWSEVWYLAHEGEPYGSLRINGEILRLEDMPYQIGRPLREVRRAWAELLVHRIPIVFETFERLLEEVRLRELYWLKVRACGNTCEKAEEKLRTPAEKVPVTPLGTPPVTPRLTAQLPGGSPAGLPESSLVGCWFVRRLVRDEEKRRKARQNGSLGGNPRLREDKD